MKLPTTYKGILKLLIAIAETGNNYNGKLTYEQQIEVGGIIADIQNGLGDAEELLTKLNLKYNS